MTPRDAAPEPSFHITCLAMPADAGPSSGAIDVDSAQLLIYISVAAESAAPNFR